MSRNRVLLICLISSVCLHAFVFTYVSFYLKTSNTPFILSWPAILTGGDLFVRNKPVEFSKAIQFTRTSNMDKSYFLASMDKPRIEIGHHNLLEIQQKPSEPNYPENTYNPKETDYIYLWDKPKSLTSWDKETVRYKAFISPYGKIILSFPTKLPVNSISNMSSQDYARQAAFFLKDKFLWTKVETVVK